jgi:hypothetical protein
MLAQDWATPPAKVADQIAEYAAGVARQEAKAMTARIWNPS